MKTQTERGIRFDISCEVCRDLMPLAWPARTAKRWYARIRSVAVAAARCWKAKRRPSTACRTMRGYCAGCAGGCWRKACCSRWWACSARCGSPPARAACILRGGCRWWARRVIMSCGAGAGWCRLQRRRVLLYFFIPNMQSLQWGSVVLYASMALAVAGPLAIGCAIAGLLHFAFGNRKEEKYADGKKH